MVKRFGQVIGLLLFVALLPTARADEPGKFAAQLQAECRQLIANGIDKPYGLAWGIAPGTQGGSAPRPVVMEPMHTPAAGLVLLWSGQVLKDQALLEAAKKAAAGVMAAQTDSGQIAPIALFGESPQPKPAEQALVDRAATRAGLALLLSIADTQLNKEPKLMESIDKASRWLRKQAHGNTGLWQRSDAAYEGGKELCVRLDDSEFRDGLFVLLLEFETINNPDARGAVERLVQQITALQLREVSEFLPGGRLWAQCYEINHEPVAFEGVTKNHADLLACRYIAQASMSVAICWAHPSSVKELSDTAERINRIKESDGKWTRFAGMDTPGASWPRGDFGLPAVLAAIKSLKSVGPDRYKQLMSQNLNPKRQLASAVVGLNDQPFTLDWPVAASEAPGYIERRAADWKAIEGPVPDSLPERISRLWLLYQRARLEAM